MLSKNQTKRIRALHRKKIRHEQNLFLVEGEKITVELLESDWPIDSLYITEGFAQRYSALITKKGINPIYATDAELTAAGTLVSNNAALAIVAMPQPATAPTLDGWVLALDRINDPGNLGALLRIADWYGISRIICSPDTADCYNPKVINASKGSFLRVAVNYQDLSAYLQALPQNTPILGAYLAGESVHHSIPSQNCGVVVMGSEAHGIHRSLAGLITHPITIPAFGAAESLNVAVATAVICDNLRRQQAFSTSRPNQNSHSTT